MKQYIVIFIALLAGNIALAQTTNITGQVIDETGEPVIGATIRVPNTGLGTITDIDGSFSLEVPDGTESINVSYLGMITPLSVNLTGEHLNISLVQTAQLLEDIIVTGYTTENKRTFSGSAKTIGDNVIEDKSTSDITEALTGEVAGVNVINGNGQPGTPAIIRIRGFGSVNGNRSPLYVVDGAPYNGSLAAINPADVATTTILKDATATALYGNRGANGVVVITTRKGTAGKSDISFDFKQGSNMRNLPYYETIQSPEEYMEIGWEGLYQAGVAVGAADPAAYANARLFSSVGIDPYYNIWDVAGQDLIDPGTGKFYTNVTRKYTPERRRDVFFNNSNRTEANVRLSGGEGSTTYATSFGVLDDVGYFLESKFRRYTGRLRVTHQVKPWLEGDMNLGYGNTTSDFSGQSGASSVNGFFLERMAPPVYGIFERNPDGTTVPDPLFGGSIYDFGEGRRGFSPLSNIAAVNKYDTDRNRIANLNGQAQLKATFLKNFELLGRFAYQNNTSNQDERTNPYYGQSAGIGDIAKTVRGTNNWTFLQMLSYANSVGDHNFRLSAAHENNDYEFKYQYHDATGLIDPFGLELDNALTQNPGRSYLQDENLESYFGIGQYDYQGKYFLNTSIRRDGSSRFSTDNRWGTFGAVGVAWLASQEDFLDTDWLDFLKVKASWGSTGDQDGAYLYGGSGNLNNITNVGTAVGFPLATPISSNLTWEKSKMLDFGIDIEAFDRIEAQFDFFNKKTTDLFFNTGVGISSGIASIRFNDGELINQGFEWDVTGHILKDKDVSLSLTLNGTTLKNELITPPLDITTGEPKVIDDQGLFGWGKGHSIYDYYVLDYVGVDPATGDAQWVQYYDDKNSNGAYDGIGERITDLIAYQSSNENVNLQKTVTSSQNEATQYYTGHSLIPDVQGAFRLNAGFKGFSLSTQLLYSMGGDGYDGNYQALLDNEVVGNGNWHQDIRNRWQQAGDVTDVPRLTNGDGSNAGNANATSTRFITNGDYLILNNVRLNYSVPESLFGKIGLKNANIWVSGDNLWAKSGRKGFFPWVSETAVTNRQRYDPLSTVTTGINFKF